MAKQTINIGTAPNDGTGTPLRTSFDYCNLNFTELYTAVGPSGNNIVVPGTATITGDLTARNWFVTGGSLPGVGNGNPFAYRIGGGGLGIGAATETGTVAPIVFYCGAGGVEQYRIAPLGVNTWSDGAGGTRMTLNSTGLGVGAIPVEKLTVAGDAEFTGGVVGQGCYLFRDGSSGGGNYSAKTGNVSLSAPASGTLRFNVNNGTFAGQFDTSGNLILSATSTPPTLTINGQLVVNATSNTNLRFSYRGSDGTTRVANLTLA
jgi:hypothetical protein